jgi:hypothetical protein
MVELIFQAVVALGGMLGVMLGMVFFLALFIQTPTEFLFDRIEGILIGIFPGLAVILEKPRLRKGIISLVTVGLGIFAAFLYQLDVIYLVSEVFAVLAVVEGPTMIGVTWFGLALTGITIGMGSSYLHDIVLKPLLTRFKPSAGDGVSHAG